MGAYQTLAAPVEHWPDPVKGSRFVGLAAPVEDADAAAELVARARERWPDASHHCWAWRLVDGRSRSSDDGEPGGSAGRPMLAMIEGHGLHDVAVVVARWFGGTKLGVGGLIRAYGGCAGQTLDRGELVHRVPLVSVRLTHDYGATSAVQGVLAAHGLAPQDTAYGAQVVVHLAVPEGVLQAVLDALRDATAGRAVLEQLG